MRPIKLTMNAFGPYAKTEIIDFTYLNGRNLFLITGPTGSGKTTIFDAISFSMYGEANGNERTVDSLRSQFAEDNILSEVELDFELKGIRYNIHRIPKQQKRKTRGDGFTEQKPEATLTIYKEDEEKVISGVTNVNDKIEEIIGINYEQFRQIMMIPQGEFKKFLIADSIDREKVLQKLFDTSIYNDIQTKLDIQEKNLFNEIKNQIINRNGYISRVKCGEEDKLNDLINSDDKNVIEILVEVERLIESDIENLNDIGTQIDNKEKLNNQLIEKIEITKRNNKQLEEKKQIEISINETEKKKSAIQLSEEKVKRAENTLQIIPLEQILKQRKTEISNKERELLGVKENLNNIFVEYSIVEKKKEEVSSDEVMNKRELCGKEITKLQYLEEKVKKIETIKSSVNNYNKSNKELERNIENLNQEINNVEEKIKSLRDICSGAKDDAIRLEKVKNEIERVKGIINKFEKIIDIDNQLEKEKKTVADIAEDLQVSFKLYNENNEKYLDYKKEFFNNQAAIIAENLKDGDTCPICGSIYHEKLTKILISGQTEAELNNLEEIYKKSLEEYNRKKNLHIKHEERLLQKEDEIKRLINDLSSSIALDFNVEDKLGIKELSGNKLKELNEKKSELIIEQKKLTDLEVKLKQYVIDINNLSELLITKKGEKKDIETKYLQVNRKLAEEQSKIEEIYNEVPIEYQELDKLELALKENEDLLINLKKDYDEAINKYHRIKEEAAILTAKEKQFKKDITTYNELYEADRIKFEQKILEMGFKDNNEYLNSKLDKDTITLLKKEVDNFNKTIHLLKEKYIELSLKTEGLVPENVIEIEEKVEINQSEKKLLLDRKNQISSKVDINTEIVEETKKINEKIFKTEEKYKTIGHLAKVAKGDNKARMTFERYVLAAFLEDIIVAANIRLKKMTNSRYILSRTDELERKNKQSGLELEVFDNYTGKSRHVKTLSGGESFKASLSMALGLSDVVQSYAGGVRLDTMFIDEGFGSLDAESLDNAILTLIDLQKSGRLVGIISHVPELKERIDARLEVTATNVGSKTEFVVM